jgi:PAS domain S-box-containing protein/diguanylate cyclase (GGDEF)-like protein
VRGLAGPVLIFDIYTVYQHWQLHKIRRHLVEQDQLFRLISENAADMIALVDREGHRLYNSPAYQTVLGYSAEELSSTASIDQVHPDDRERVIEAARKANSTGHGQRIEYRMRHKDGSWRILESTASPIRGKDGEVDRTVIVNRDITERKRAQEQLAHTTLHDGLTNLPNRTLFLDRLQDVITMSKRQTRYTFAVLFIDVDDFKVFNESLGNNFGDELLIQIAQRLSASVRSLDTISRTFGSNSQSGLVRGLLIDCKHQHLEIRKTVPVGIKVESDSTRWMHTMSLAGILGSPFVNYEAQSVQNRMQQARKDFQQLGRDLQSGNLSAAQSDFATEKSSEAIKSEFVHSEQLYLAGFAAAFAGSAVREHYGCATGLQ